MAEGRKIITVTQGGVLYRDEKSIVQWIDFQACNANWAKGYKKPLEEEARIVGWRHYYLPYVELATEPKIRFEFANIDQADHQLLVPMYRYGGWYTWLHVAELLSEDEIPSENAASSEDAISSEEYETTSEDEDSSEEYEITSEDEDSSQDEIPSEHQHTSKAAGVNPMKRAVNKMIAAFSDHEAQPAEDITLSKPLLIFVAGPYRSPDSIDRAANVNAVRKVVKQLMLKGHFVLDGHWLLHTFFGDDRIDNDEIMRQTLSWLERCDAIYVLDRSAGVEREIEKAQELGLQVFNSLDEIPLSDGSQREIKLA